MDSKLHSFLADWAFDFIRNKDVIQKKIESIEKNKDGFDLYVKYKDKEQYVIVADLNDINEIIKKIKGNAHFMIIALNSKSNLDSLIKNWKMLIEFRFLSIIFVNPFSELEKKWIVFPHTHHRICDESSLKTGLNSMFGMVEPIDEQQIVAKITG